MWKLVHAKTTFLFIASLLVSVGCGAKAHTGGPPASAGRTISRAEVTKSGAGTMWDALTLTVRFVRFEKTPSGQPRRASRRGESSMVLSDEVRIYIDHVRVLSIDLLSSLPAKDIERIQVIDGVAATTYYGTNAGDGVILIFTRGE